MLDLVPHARPALSHRVPLENVVGPQPMPLAIDDTCVTEQRQMVRHSWLLDGQHCFHITHTHPTAMLAQNIENLEPDGMGNEVEVITHLLRLRSAHTGWGRIRAAPGARCVFLKDAPHTCRRCAHGASIAIISKYVNIQLRLG